MWISKPHEEEYRRWVDDGQFDTIIRNSSRLLADALTEENPALIATSLDRYSTCYFRRGIVALLDERRFGWNDVQCGYWAALHELLFEVKANCLPGWSYGQLLSGARLTQSVTLLALARLFRQDGDEVTLGEIISPRFDIEEALGDANHWGETTLRSILEPKIRFTLAELLQDRKLCCQHRDLRPRRPTEIDPFGVLDVEIMLRFPEEAAFEYAGRVSADRGRMDQPGDCGLPFLVLVMDQPISSNAFSNKSISAIVL